MDTHPPDVPQFEEEPEGNALRLAMARAEPRGLRTYTPTLSVIARSEGCYHYTVDGRKLADFTSGVLVANLGHFPRRWWQRVLAYLDVKAQDGDAPFLRGVPLNAYNALTQLECIATQRLLANLRAQPGGARMEQVMWAASGSEAVQKALWAALAQRKEADIILATRHGFHGKKGLSGAVTGTEQDPDRDPRVRFIDFPRESCASWELRQSPLDLEPHRRELDSLLSAYGNRLGCLITEPYLGGGGSYHPQPEYLQLLQSFCRAHDLVFILDEVQSNFGRTGSMYAFTTYGIEPDVVVLGKGMGNGIPVNAAVGRADVLGSLRYGEGSDTWSAHPLGCAATLATLDEFETEPILDRARELSQVLQRGLLRLAEWPTIAAIRGEGTVWGIECADLKDSSGSDVARSIVKNCYLGDGQGYNIHLLGPLAGKVIRVAPPLVMPCDEAEAYLDAMFEIVSSMIMT